MDNLNVRDFTTVQMIKCRVIEDNIEFDSTIVIIDTNAVDNLNEGYNGNEEKSA